MTLVVVDASAIVELLLRTPTGGSVGRHLGEAVAPELLDVETVSAIGRLTRAGHVTALDGRAAVRRLQSLPVDRVPHAPLVGAVWELRDRVRIADAFYVALAMTLQVGVLTTDARLARAPLPGVSVTLVR